MKAYLSIFLAFFLGACSIDSRGDDVCSKISLEEVGDVRLVDSFVAGPVVGGRGPFGPSIAIELKKESSVFSALSSGVDEISIWPVVHGLRSSMDPHPGSGECMPWVVDEKDSIVCGYNIERKNVYLYVRYTRVDKGNDFSEHKGRTKKISSLVESEVFCGKTGAE